MEPHILIKALDGKFRRFEKVPGVNMTPEASEFIRPLPADLGRGNFYNLGCREGLSICLSRCRFERDYQAKVTWPVPMVTFVFCLSGRTRTHVADRKSPLEIAAGEAFIIYCEDPCLERITKGGDALNSMAVHMLPETLSRLANPFENEHSKAEVSLMEDLETHQLFPARSMTPRMICLLEEMFACPHRGMIWKLYLESRALELIAYHLEQLFRPEARKTAARPLSQKERDRICRARDILVSRLRFPPALPDLAGQVGMSHARLTRGFKKVWGCTVFEYLRKERLKYGLELLQEHRFSITEVAFEAGFSSSSHFAAAFHNAYGVSPSEYRQGG